MSSPGEPGKTSLNWSPKVERRRFHIYLCPKPFLEEMDITFSKGDEITVTGSKVKDGTSDVILARQLVRNNDTLMFRDDKGNPVWAPRTGK